MSSEELERQSVTVWLQDLKEGSNEAANQLWRRYFEKLIGLARNQLRLGKKRVSDEEDIAVCVFQSLCEGVSKGRFAQLDDRDDLWKLLIVMTRHKSQNQLRHQQTLKRGGKIVRGHSVVNAGEADANVGFDRFFGDDPTPDSLVEIEEEIERLLGLLADESHRKIAQLRWQGYSIEEVAGQLGISSRSVKRKLAIIRDTWIVELIGTDSKGQDSQSYS